MGEMRNARAILVRKPKGKRPFGRPRRRCEEDDDDDDDDDNNNNNNRMDVREIRGGGGVVSSVKPSGSIKGGEFRD
jgi:hypothetical protein